MSDIERSKGRKRKPSADPVDAGLETLAGASLSTPFTPSAFVDTSGRNWRAFDISASGMTACSQCATRIERGWVLEEPSIDFVRLCEPCSQKVRA